MAARKKQNKAAEVSLGALKNSNHLRSFELDGLVPGGGPGTFYYRSFSARRVLDFMDEHEKDKTNQQRVRETIGLLAEMLKTADGKQFATEDDLWELPMDAVLALGNGLMADISGAREREGNVSSGAEDSASDTPLPAN